METHSLQPLLHVDFLQVVAPDAPFLQPGWHSPLLNTKIDLQPLLDSVTQLPGGSAADEGSLDEKKRARVVVLEFWASWSVLLCSSNLR